VMGGFGLVIIVIHTWMWMTEVPSRNEEENLRSLGRMCPSGGDAKGC
jgi:hypothetical protein